MFLCAGQSLKNEDNLVDAGVALEPEPVTVDAVRKDADAIENLVSDDEESGPIVNRGPAVQGGAEWFRIAGWQGQV